MNIGSDMGNITSVAVGEVEVIEESRLKETEDQDILKDSVFDFDGEKFTLNEGDFENNPYKHEKLNFDKLLYLTLYKASPDSINNVCFSIPAKQFRNKEIVNNFYEVINNNRIHTVNGRTIIINKVNIIPEGYGIKALGILEENENLLENAPVLVIDIGGETTDLILFDKNHVFSDGRNVRYGLLKLYEKAGQYLEDKYGLELTIAEAKDYFNGDTILLDDPDNKDNYRNDLILKAFKEILNKILRYFPNMKQYNLIICGGGAELMYPLFKRFYPQSILVDDIAVNARGNKEIADVHWAGEDEEIELIPTTQNLITSIWEDRNKDNEKLMMGLWQNDQGKEILSDLLGIESEKEIRNNYNVKDYLRECLGE